jgi:hypothetical protein
MQNLPLGKLKKPQNDLDQLIITVNLANELCRVSAITEVKEKSTELRKLCTRYESATPVTEKRLATALENSLNDLSLRSSMLGIVAGKSPLLKRIRKWSGHEEPDTIKISPIIGATLLDSLNEDTSAQTPTKPDPEAILTAGIQDVTNTLVEDYNLNDVLLMVLETIHRSLGFKHTLIFIRDNKQNLMAAKFGFGEHVDTILPRLKFSLTFIPDVFHLTIDKGLDIVIEDVHAEKISDKIPEWYSEAIDANCFLLLPVMVNKKAVGLIYADMQKANSLQISERQLSLLRTLRNQAVLAIKQKFM